MKTNLQEESSCSAYVARCANLVLRADHHVVSRGQSYAEIEIAAEVPTGTLTQLMTGGLPAPDHLDSLEGYLFGEESLLDSLRAQLESTRRDLVASREESAARAEEANEARAALAAETDSHAKTHEALAALASQHAVALDKLFESRRLSQRISGQFEILGTALYEVSTGMDALAEELADGQER